MQKKWNCKQDTMLRQFHKIRALKLQTSYVKPSRACVLWETAMLIQRVSYPVLWLRHISLTVIIHRRLLFSVQEFYKKLVSLSIKYVEFEVTTNDDSLFHEVCMDLCNFIVQDIRDSTEYVIQYIFYFVVRISRSWQAVKWKEAQYRTKTFIRYRCATSWYQVFRELY
jgi:hypothetical protein